VGRTELLAHFDQLQMAKRQGDAFFGFEEGNVADFLPTYRVLVGKGGEYDPKRLPAWCDHMLSLTQLMLFMHSTHFVFQSSIML
jgi:hypothetical protein